MPDAPHLLFRLRSVEGQDGAVAFLTEYLVSEIPETWVDKEALHDWKPVLFSSADEAWAKAAALSTPEQRVHAAPRQGGRKIVSLRTQAPRGPSHPHRPYDPNWRNRVPNVGGLD